VTDSVAASLERKLSVVPRLAVRSSLVPVRTTRKRLRLSFTLFRTGAVVSGRVPSPP
jgi:hypothetical protein